MNKTQALYQSVMYLNCIFEAFLLFHFLKAIFVVHENRRWVTIMGLFGCPTLIFIINSFRLPGINILCVPIIYLFFVWLIFRLELKYNILYVFVFYLMMSITEFIFFYIYKVFGINPTIMGWKRILLLIIQATLRMLIVQILNRQHQGKITRNSETYQYLKFLFVLPIATFILLYGFIVSDQFPLKNFLICLGSALLIVSNIIDFFMIEKLLKAENMAKEREMIAQKTKLEQLYYSRLEEINESNAEYIHEMSHFIRTIKELSCTNSKDVIQKLADEVSEKSKPMRNKYYLEDKITNAILLEREKKAAASNIEYQVDIQPGIHLAFMEDTDKISMFGNLLDNALEAADGIEDGYVHVSLFIGNQAFVIFKVINNYKTKLQKQGNKYLTSKKNKEQHGFGIKKVQELTEKYKGEMYMKDKENTFEVTLLLSNMQISDN